MATRDANRFRKVYSFSRNRPTNVATETTTSSDMSDLILTNVKVANYGVAIGDYVAYDPTGTSNVIITLPTAVGNKDKRVGVKNVSSNLTEVGVSAQPTQTIDGERDFFAKEDGLSAIFRSDGADWLIEELWYNYRVDEFSSLSLQRTIQNIATTGSLTPETLIAVNTTNIDLGSFTTLKIIPLDSLTANDTNYATITFSTRDSAGGSKVEERAVTTKTIRGGGTGDWTAFTPLTYDSNMASLFFSGTMLTCAVSKSGDGVIVPFFHIMLTK